MNIPFFSSPSAVHACSYKLHQKDVDHTEKKGVLTSQARYSGLVHQGHRENMNFAAAVYVAIISVGTDRPEGAFVIFSSKKQTR